MSKQFEESDNPALQAAYKAKKDEKAQGAKVQAIRYLATLDCKCGATPDRNAQCERIDELLYSK